MDRAGQLRGATFADVPSALKRWHAAGLTLAIYSSGSVLAQRLIFSMTDDGDLTPLVSHFFDTTKFLIDRIYQLINRRQLSADKFFNNF